MSFEIIVKDKSKPLDGGVHETNFSRDGRDPHDKLLEQCHERGRGILTDELGKLRRAGYKCDLRTHPLAMKNTAIVGVFHNEPFAVYIKWIAINNETCAVITTRYKGEDHEFKSPEEILK